MLAAKIARKRSRVEVRIRLERESCHRRPENDDLITLFCEQDFDYLLARHSSARLIAVHMIMLFMPSTALIDLEATGV